ncbi:MAG: hypothetical protein IVW57_02485 [Ktedonobacterales bacterium]|nr:hypothetical protein [Ktedonobacterales bacterium]
MHCAACGEVVETFHQHCPHCGAALPTRAQWQATWDGIPITRYTPTPYGPPVVPDAAPPPAARRARMGRRRAKALPPRAHAPFSDMGSGQQDGPLTTPSAGAQARKWGRLAATLAFAALLAIGVWRSGGTTLVLGALGPRAAPTATVCGAPPTDPTATRALAAAQLTTGLRDRAHGDYRPTNRTTTFHAGQRAYLTFQITTSAGGDAGVLFCTAGERVPGSLVIPAASAGRYAQFSAPLTPSDVGRAIVVLTWNGRAAVVLPFTVVATPS